MARAISHVTPMAVDVDFELPMRESMELLFRCEGLHPGTLASTEEFHIRPRPAVPSCPVPEVSVPDPNSLDPQSRLARERTDTPITFNAGRGAWGRSVQTMEEGAVEFLMNPPNHNVLLAAVREGLDSICVALAREVEMRNLRNRYASLTRRERQVLALVVSGFLNKQVGEDLGISEIAVKAHRRRVMQKMQAECFADLMKMATRLGPHRALNGSGSGHLAANRK